MDLWSIQNMDENFILDAWQKFDDWAKKQNIILEFIRFNPLKKIITCHIKIRRRI